MKSILFVCTGNIFRSLTAEYALKALLGSAPAYAVSSAGTEAVPQKLSVVVKTTLQAQGIDPTGHQQRKLTAEMLDAADLVVAMGLDHEAYIEIHFGHKATLFNTIYCGEDLPLLDVWEAVPNWREDVEARKAYIISTVNYICEAMPVFVENVEGYF